MLNEQLIRINRGTLNNCWLATINHLSTFDHIVVNREMLNNISWPVTYGFTRDQTPTGLITYRGVNLFLRLKILNNSSILKVLVEGCNKLNFYEQEVYTGSTGHGYQHYLDKDFNLQNEFIFLEERYGAKLTREQALSCFSRTTNWSQSYSFTWYMAVKDDAWVKNRLEAVYNQRAKESDPALITKKEDALYAKYLKNRYPRVCAFLGVKEVK